MKDMKMKVKLMISFVSVAVLTLVAGLVGVLEVRSLASNENAVHLYALGANGVTDLQRNVQAQRAAYRGAVMLTLLEEGVDEEFVQLEQLDRQFREGMDFLLSGVDDDAMRGMLTEADGVYTQVYAPLRQQLVEGIRSGNDTAAGEVLNRIIEPLAQIQTTLDTVAGQALGIMEQTVAEDTAAANLLAILLIVLVVLAVGLAVFYAFYISHLIAAPLERMAREVRKLSTGNFNVHPDIDQKDEIGVVDHALWQIVSTMLEQQDGIIRMAKGDFTHSFPVRSPEDSMNRALNKLVANFNGMMGEIRDSAAQVGAGANQMAQASQELATGSSQQSATIEQLTSSLASIQSMAEANSAAAEETHNTFQEAARIMADCNGSMERMLAAMENIDEKSGSISRVIKAIDDIAFQTNILALNAAVEAARAGQHGKGFAVVADEVRNLASKSADAARETAELIQQSIESVGEGNAIVEQVGSNIRMVGDIVDANQRSLEGIDSASRKQKEDITEVAEGVRQLTDVVQSNTDSAEETAAFSEEMSAQAASLENVLARFRLKDQAELPALPAAEAKGLSLAQA